VTGRLKGLSQGILGERFSLSRSLWVRAGRDADGHPEETPHGRRRPLEVHRVRGGWRQVPDPRGPRRVRYDAWRDRLLIESAGGGLEIRFHWRHATFAWRGKSDRIRPRFGGGLTIYVGDRPVAEGRFSWSGLSIDSFDRDLASIGGELVNRSHAPRGRRLPQRLS
jgi:hypothetical protein